MKAFFTYCLIFLSQFEAQEIWSRETATAVLERARTAATVSERARFNATLIKSIEESPAAIVSLISNEVLKSPPPGFWDAMTDEIDQRERIGDQRGLFRLLRVYEALPNSVEMVEHLVNLGRNLGPLHRNVINTTLARAVADGSLETAQHIHKMTFERAPIGYRFALEHEFKRHAREGHYVALHRLMQTYMSQTGPRTQRMLKRQLGSLVQKKFLDLVEPQTDGPTNYRWENTGQRKYVLSLLILRHDGLGSRQCEEILRANMPEMNDAESKIYRRGITGGTIRRFVPLTELY